MIEHISYSSNSQDKSLWSGYKTLKNHLVILIRKNTKTRVLPIIVILGLYNENCIFGFFFTMKIAATPKNKQLHLCSDHDSDEYFLCILCLSELCRTNMMSQKHTSKGVTAATKVSIILLSLSLLLPFALTLTSHSSYVVQKQHQMPVQYIVQRHYL